MPRDVVRVMVEDHPLAVDGEDYNLQVEVRKIQSCVFIQSLAGNTCMRNVSLASLLLLIAHT